MWQDREAEKASQLAKLDDRWKQRPWSCRRQVRGNLKLKLVLWPVYLQRYTPTAESTADLLPDGTRSFLQGRGSLGIGLLGVFNGLLGVGVRLRVGAAGVEATTEGTGWAEKLGPHFWTMYS